MPAGRPRTVTPPPEEMIKLGEEMVEWVKSNNPLHLSEWYSTEMFFTEKVWDTMQRAPEFFPYYEQAMRIIGKKYIDKTSNVRDGISHRWQRVYFNDLRKLEDEDAKTLAELNKQKDGSTEEQQAKIDALLSQLAKMQYQLSSQSERNMANISINEEAKSD